jgi:3-methyl-2-oxobutanoate hydroxymethyltransferase
MLTAYDASFAGVAERAGVDVLLVGDSLGMVVQGHPTTLPVTLEQMLYHVRCVVAGCARPLVVADLPFGTFQGRVDDAYRASVAALKVGAQMVKIEGGGFIAATVEYLSARGVPVCGHVGLTPQSVNVLGGFKVQGRGDEAAQRVLEDARQLCEAGAAMLVVECVPRALGAEVTRASTVPVIGIGAGPDCSGQVLVVYDAIGAQPGKAARFVRNFLVGHDSIQAAVRAYVVAVKDGSFPGPEHCF